MIAQRRARIPRREPDHWVFEVRNLTRAGWIFSRAVEDVCGLGFYLVVVGA